MTPLTKQKLIVFMLSASALMSGCNNDDSTASDPKGSPPPSGKKPTNEDSIYAIKNVSVIPMTGNMTLPNQTVIVKNGEISQLGDAATIEIPEDAETIDGSDRYLMPGLADMHTHPLCGLRGQGDDETVACELGKNHAEIYLAHGVTTILTMHDSSGIDRNLMKTELADPINRGELAGPYIYTASFAGGPNDLPGGIRPNQIVETEEDGRNHVIQSKAQGYDFIKLYDGVSEEAFDGIISQAEQENISVVGHFSEKKYPLPPENASEEEKRKANSRLIQLEDGLAMVAHAADYSRHALQWGFTYEEMANITKDNDVYLNTTLILPKKSIDLECENEAAFQNLITQPQTQYASPLEIIFWRRYLTIITGPTCRNDIPSAAERYATVLDYLRYFYHVKNIKLIMGTDSPLVWGVAGHSAYEELDAIAELNLTPYQTLETATRNAGEFIAKHIPTAQEFGTIEVGKRADLLLLENNPLFDLSHIQSQVGVMANGRWYSAQDLEDSLTEIASTYAELR